MDPFVNTIEWMKRKNAIENSRRNFLLVQQLQLDFYNQIIGYSLWSTVDQHLPTTRTWFPNNNEWMNGWNTAR